MSDIIEATQQTLNADLLRLQTISQNMAHTNSVGYKREILRNSGFSQVMQSHFGELLAEPEKSKDLRPGALKPTNDPLDVALDGEGYFVVRSAGGESELYTRRGQFMVNDNGQLALRTGELLIGEQGPIQLTSASFDIRRNGEIWQNEKAVDRLQVAQVQHAESLEDVGSSLFRSTGPVARLPREDIRMVQGSIEASNVNMMTEMVNLVEVSRHFEMTHNVLRAYDGTLDSAINVLGNF